MERRLAGSGQPPLLGRGRECAVLDDLVAAVRGGESRSLVLRGEAGIGKTALLNYLVESASDMTVLRAVGVQSEMELAYAGLHLLCWPLLDRLPRLPGPQRGALEIVFGLSDGAPPDRFLVGLAVLSLLSDAGEERPLVWVVDDAQWLDHASALTLAFVARRLLAEPVGIVFAAREPGDALQHVTELEVQGMRSGDARTLLNSAVQFKLDEQVRDRIIAETRGNPLALLELPQGLTPTELAGGFGLVGGRGLSGRIEESFARRLDTLSDASRRLLLIAAAEPIGDPVLLLRAAERLGVESEAAGAVESAGLVAIDARVTFRHPLVRSAVYRSGAVEDRRAVHLALAEATDRAADPDRRAWHLAAAAAGPDANVASELEQSAERAQSRGGLAAAAAFLERAVGLTVERELRAQRALAGAQAHYLAGASEAALRLLAIAEAGPLSELGRARADMLRAQIAYSQNRASEAPGLLLRAARRLEEIDAELSCATYLDALSARMVLGRASGDVGIEELGRAALAALAAFPVAPSDLPRPADLLLEGVARRATDGYAGAAPALKRAVSAFRSQEIPRDEALRQLWLVSRAALVLWDDEAFDELTARYLALSRDGGALAVHHFALTARIAAEVFTGHLASGAQLVEELRAVMDATGSQLPPYGSLFLAAGRGREPEASELLSATISKLDERSEEPGLAIAHWSSAVLYNGLGRYDAALEAAARASENPTSLGIANWGLVEGIEAAVRCGSADRGVDALDRLSDMTRASGTDWALGLEARSRALLSDSDTAERGYREAIERLARTRLRPELARSRLVYGEWLRRENRRVDARAQLRAAHEEFAAMGMEAFTERARGELLATGEKVRKRTAESRDELTPQERQIARLACDGLSNAEIGARLFLSPRTIEWHLRKIFTKLDIRSRRELIGGLRGFELELRPT